MATTLRLMLAGALALSLGCEGKGDPGDGDTGADTGITGTGTQGDNTATMTASTTDPPVGSGEAETSADGGTESESADASASASAGSDGSGGSDGTDTQGGGPGVDCGGTTYACGDGVDNDKDGFTDLFDPECTGPCDDDEGSFQTGIPGDNMDCKQDCFFDGNSGQGDDGCIWDLRCDPENPGEFIGCEYTGGNNCNNQPPNQDQDCIDFCSPYVPPGCDCFGCCEVQTDMGIVNIFLNSHPDCALDNLEACTECTPQIDDCGNPCEPELCEVCFGETEPPPGCDGAECIGGDPCESNTDCPEGYFCYLNCCYPPPPG